ncbi:MAG: peptidoglycan recognition family protein, partial [Phycisphaerae bacterium]
MDTNKKPDQSSTPQPARDSLPETLDQLAQSPFSRRSMLALLGLSAAATFLSACETTGTNGHVVDNLPEQPLLPGGGGAALVPDPIQYAPPTTTFTPPGKTYTPPPGYTAGAIIPRSVWAKAGPNLRTIDPMSGVRLITFHHSGDSKPFLDDSFGGTAQHLEWVREYHVGRRFQDIGYHFAIDRGGRIWQLRSLKYQGQHVRYNNEHNIGVVVLGNFDIQQPTAAQKERIKSFSVILRKQYNLPRNRV